MSHRAGARFLLDRSVRRSPDGRVLVGGSPLRVLTLTDSGAVVVDALAAGDDPTTRSAAAGRLVERFVDLGIAHPVGAGTSGPTDTADATDLDRWAREVTVVTPCKDELPRHPAWSAASVVVDDGSVPPLFADGVVPGRARTVRLARNAGPGAARNTGLAQVDTPLVAFVDADVEVDEAELARLVSWFDDLRVALVAPRVRAVAGPGVLAAFEATRSPLDLGDEPARVAATTRVSYVPAAVLLCRTAAIRDVGGFDGSLRYGEDVDLVWRLAAAGWRCRYDPSVEAHHRTRPDLRRWLAQRFRYGTSAAPLARRHPGALAPLRMSPWSAATWVPVAAGLPVVGVTVGVATSVALVRELPQVPARESLRLAGLGNLYAGRLWCETLSRAWWPAALVAAALSRRARRTVAIAWSVPIVLDAVRHLGRRRSRGTARRSRLDPVRFALLHLADDLAYGAGVWVGAWRERSVDALLPRFESWPPRRPAPSAPSAPAAPSSDAGGAELA